MIQQSVNQQINQFIYFTIVADLIINKLLCFLACQYDKVDKDALNSVICDFYSFEESVAAKQILADECDKLGLTDSILEFKKRRQNAKGNGNLKVVKDIIDIWNVVDCQRGGNVPFKFVALDPNRLPSNDANELNIRHLITQFSLLEKRVSENSSLLSDIGNTVSRIDKKTVIRNVISGVISRATCSAISDASNSAITNA